MNLRALRRTLALELAYRPGGVLATKIHLKHVAVATTEGYASRPGGAQAELLAEVNKHESARNLDLVWAELRNYQQGIMPAGPGARELTEFFAHIDAKLTPTDTGAGVKVQRNDREVLALLTKRAATLHLAAANYCWFTDPSRALCLKLADTPHADKPLAGMCDSGRCPQATHHPCHRPIWAEHAEQDQDVPRRPRPDPQDREDPPAGRAPPRHPRPGRDRHRRQQRRHPVRLSADQRHQNETRIRAAIDRLLRGQIPANGKCDIKTLAREAGIDRTAFYGDRPYTHLREEFETRLAALAATGELPDPRDAQIARLRNEVATLNERLAHRDQTITEHGAFRAAALSQLAAQHEEIVRLRHHADETTNIRQLMTAKTTSSS